jgi:hypothetical protein
VGYVPRTPLKAKICQNLLKNNVLLFLVVVFSLQRYCDVGCFFVFFQLPQHNAVWLGEDFSNKPLAFRPTQPICFYSRTATRFCLKGPSSGFQDNV